MKRREFITIIGASTVALPTPATERRAARRFEPGMRNRCHSRIVSSNHMAWGIQAVNAGRIEFGLPSLAPRL